jgi:hypothetical protein
VAFVIATAAAFLFRALGSTAASTLLFRVGIILRVGIIPLSASLFLFATAAVVSFHITVAALAVVIVIVIVGMGLLLAGTSFAFCISAAAVLVILSPLFILTVVVSDRATSVVTSHGASYTHNTAHEITTCSSFNKVVPCWKCCVVGLCDHDGCGFDYPFGIRARATDPRSNS